MNHHKGFIAPLLLILAGVFLIGGGAYVYMQNRQADHSAVTPVTQNTDSQTADWKTYTDPQYGFSFQYPPGFVIDSQDSNKLSNPIRFISSVKPAPDALSMDQIGVVKTSMLPTGSLCAKIASNEDMLDTGWVEQAGGVYRALCFASKDLTLVVTSASSQFTKANAESVLSSFKFVTQATPTTKSTDPQTADWKTYQNEKYGFEFKYPKEYGPNNGYSPMRYAVDSWYFRDAGSKTRPLSMFGVGVMNLGAQGGRFKYDAKEQRCYNDPPYPNSVPFQRSTVNGYIVCKSSSGDAGSYGSSLYILFPDGKKALVVESGGDQTSVMAPIEQILSTLNLNP